MYKTRLGCFFKKKYPILSEEENIIKELRKKNSLLHTELIRFSLEYANKISGMDIDDVVIGIRSSLLFRLGSLIFHYEYLVNHKEQYLKEITQKPLNEKTHQIAQSVTNTQSIIFDDLIFNSVSVFDYLGYFMSVLTYGIHKKWTWNKLYKAAKNNDRKIGSSIFKEKLVKVHSDFIDNLYEFRSELIHYQTYGLNYDLSYVGTEGVKFKLHPPKDFLKVLRRADLIKSEDDEHLHVDSLETFLTHCFDVVSDILDLSLKHIEENRKRDESERIYFFGNPDKD